MPLIPDVQTTSGSALESKPQFAPGTIYVTFSKLGNPMGWIAWDGHKYSCDFPNSRPDFGNDLLKEVIHRPKHHRDITSDTPYEWLSGLHLMLHDAYMQVSKLQTA